jgi:hypothetical protein
MEQKQQQKIDAQKMERSTAETPAVHHARERDNAPGELGGHV